jgi:hypothetical protein
MSNGFYCKQAGESINRSAIALVMVGYRNASVLVSRRGILDRGKTTNLGMSRMVELVMERTSGLQEQPLISAIVAAGVDPKPTHFLPLVSSGDCTKRNAQGDCSLRDDQIEKIIAAVRIARNEYAIAKRCCLQQIALTLWLREVLPQSGDLDEAIVCGGTADYLRDELDAVFPATPVVWHGAVTIPSKLNEQWLGNRLADVWALSVYHSAKVKAQARRLELEEEVVSHG